MAERKRGMTRIAAKVEGIERAKLPLKAVVYVKEREEIKVLAEMDVEKDEFELELGLDAEDLPETVKLVVVPREVAPKSHIQRLAETGHAPATTIRRDLVLARRGRVAAGDLRLKPVDDVVGLWPLKHWVCGRVVKRDPVTGEECYVPGATVRVLDVDLHLFWWYPYPGFPWFWLFPYWPRREEIATTKTDECGRFCVDVPYFDIDAILRWRLRFRCLWENLRLPRVLDAIDLGVKPDLRVYPELEDLPELEPKPRPEPGPDPRPFIPVIPLPPPEQRLLQMPLMAERMSEFYTKPKYELVRQALFAKGAMFDPVESEKLPVLERPAFPKSIAPPGLPDDETLLKILPDEEMLPAVRSAHPIVRLLRCWPEIVPEIHLILDIPDIVFKVEQDTDADGTLETIYDEGYFDVNWNLSEPTTNVIIEAWENAICVPCGPAYEPCTTTGIVGISEMPVTSACLSTQGYAVRVNRPNPSGTMPVPSPIARPDDAETPFCGTVRLVGCSVYGKAAYYKVFCSYENRPESYFNESWYVHQISTGTPHHVVPDASGFYPVLTPANDYFPYHTLINWPTHKYKDGRYEVHLALYDAGKNLIWPKGPTPYINAVLDNRSPSKVGFLGLRWRVAVTGSWNNLPLNCPIVRRPAGADIELEVTYNVVATHLRNLFIGFYGCEQPNPLLDSDAYWHQYVGDNNVLRTWTTTVSGSRPAGAYRFHLSGRSRAFRGTGGLASNWYFDPLHIWRVNNLPIAILDV